MTPLLKYYSAFNFYERLGVFYVSDFRQLCPSSWSYYFNTELNGSVVSM